MAALIHIEADQEPRPPTAAWAIVFACVLAGGVALSALILAAIFGLGAVIAALLY